MTFDNRGNQNTPKVDDIISEAMKRRWDKCIGSLKGNRWLFLPDPI
jgi:hypothetical protein